MGGTDTSDMIGRERLSSKNNWLFICWLLLSAEEIN